MNEKNIDYEKEIGDFTYNLLDLGYLDLKATIDLIKEYKLNVNDVTEYIKEWLEDTGSSLTGNKLPLDTTALTYEFILNRARNEIEQKTGKDILNDTEGSLYVHSNYLCSCFDYSTEDQEEIKKIVKDVKDFSHLTKTFLEDIGIEVYEGDL